MKLLTLSEFFSSYSFLILLSDTYSGKNISTTYCYDVLKNKELKKDVKLKLTHEEVKDVYKFTKDDSSSITTKLKRVLGIANQIQVDDAIDNLIRKSVNKVFDKYKNEPLVTEKLIEEFSEEVSIAFVKFMLRGQNRDNF
jgi:hypothetical protein